MSGTTTNPFLIAMDDAERLVRWVEPNTTALEDEQVEAAVLRALGGPVPTDLHLTGVPLLRFADTAIPAVPLIDAVINDVRHDARTCDLCGSSERSIFDRLIVPAGASVVVLHTCWRCKAILDRAPRHSSLVWS